MPTSRGFTALVLVASSAVLSAALLSQYWGGLAPCELCLAQRWPWGVAIGKFTGLNNLLSGRKPGSIATVDTGFRR